MDKGSLGLGLGYACRIRLDKVPYAAFQLFSFKEFYRKQCGHRT